MEQNLIWPLFLQILVAWGIPILLETRVHLVSSVSKACRMSAFWRHVGGRAVNRSLTFSEIVCIGDIEGFLCYLSATQDTFFYLQFCELALLASSSPESGWLDSGVGSVYKLLQLCNKTLYHLKHWGLNMLQTYTSRRHSNTLSEPCRIHVDEITTAKAT